MNGEALACVLKPLGTVFALAVAARNSFYDRGWLKTFDCGRPVISIGNLTAGGTGKTPFTALLAEGLMARGVRPAVISRGYKAELEHGFGRIDLTHASAKASFLLGDIAVRYGDEPAMLAARLRDVPVFVGRDKVDVARRAVEEIAPSVLLADDAFQHRRLARAFDIVLIDVSEPTWHFQPLPAGRMREPFAALRRADAVVLTKVNLASPSRLDRLRDQARVAIDSGKNVSFVELEYRLKTFIYLESIGRLSDDIMDAHGLRGERVLLCSGIGRPEGFRDLMGQETGAEIVGHEAFPDHHFFSARDLKRVAASANEKKASCIVVTEKDAVKLNPNECAAAGFPCPVLVSRLEAVPRQSLDGLYERLADESLR